MGVVVVVLVTLVAAALSALSAAGEQRAAARLAGRRRSRPQGPGAAMRPATGARRIRLGLAFATALLTTPLWLGSWLVDASSFVAQAAALHLGSLSVVQPLMVTTLLFSLPLAALGTGRRPTARDWLAAAGIGVGLGLVLSTRDAAAAAGSAPVGGSLVPVLASVLIAVVALVVLSRGRSAPVRAALLSVAAGVLFAVGAALTKLTADTAVTSGFAGLLTGWPGYLLAAVSVASFALQQAAYTMGTLATAVTAVVVVDPLVSYALGVAAFGEPLPAAGLPMVQAALGMVVLGVSVAVLARSPLLQPAGSGRPEPVAPGGQGGRVGAGERVEEPPYDIDVIVPAAHARYPGRQPAPCA
ncbi:DMT family transporter [Pseudonocardia dioxanivorans]|uniref:DMT family transporter n=1 Tax=Pseudonocardia dioxanivorans TaxID=240495 RepID=UPI000CD01A9E|nr:DMT family transporter [Pseudonocardia dioxanivorans]